MIQDILSKLTADPLMMAVVLLGVALFASKVLKLDLSKFIVPLVNSLLKPPTPTVPGTPVVLPPGTPPVLPVNPTTTLMQLLINLLNQSKASGDAETEADALKLLNRISQPK